MFGYLAIAITAVLSGWLGFHTLEIGSPVLAAVWFFIAGILASFMLALAMRDAVDLHHHQSRHS
ncbi:hypothetical protein [Uliginosibacterium sp. H1]|uniref:hypothetical protein n=1 Tax=Uliginosibacterium sp. H1 TaxID=3114757 RepID=UPI002E16E86C|nr:hypothetical protein [Uliginosibacterium sp. H1]